MDFDSFTNYYIATKNKEDDPDGDRNLLYLLESTEARNNWNTWVANNPKANISFEGFDFTYLKDYLGKPYQHNSPKEELKLELLGIEAAPYHEHYLRDMVTTDFRSFNFPIGIIDFSNVKFPGKYIYFNDIDFSHCYFSLKGDNLTNHHIMFQGTKFGEHGCSFSKTFRDCIISFKNAEFIDAEDDCYARVYFYGSHFINCKIDFESAHIEDSHFNCEKIILEDSQFNFKGARLDYAVMSFDYAKFHGSSLSFKDTDLSRPRISFDFSIFTVNTSKCLTQDRGGYLCFENMKLDGTGLEYFCICSTTVEAGINFRNAYFLNCSVHANNSTFGHKGNFIFTPKKIENCEIINFTSCLFESPVILNNTLGPIDFSDSHFRHSINFDNIDIDMIKSWDENSPQNFRFLEKTCSRYVRL